MSPFGHVAVTVWPALVAFVLGFAAMVPFMNTSLISWHPLANALDGADLAFYVGFVVAGILYFVLRGRAAGGPAAARAEPAVGVTGEAGLG